jgi:hypothetical protein
LMQLFLLYRYPLLLRAPQVASSHVLSEL